VAADFVSSGFGVLSVTVVWVIKDPLQMMNNTMASYLGIENLRVVQI